MMLIPFIVQEEAEDPAELSEFQQPHFNASNAQPKHDGGISQQTVAYDLR